MAKYIQRSFSHGVYSSNLLSRPDIEGYNSCARNLNNFLIGYLGEAYRRGGTRIIASGSNSYVRVIPFYVGSKTFIICFKTGRITNDRSKNKDDCDNIDIYEITDLNLRSKPLNDIDEDFLPKVDCKIFGDGSLDELTTYESYINDVSDGYSESELLGMDYTQLGAILVFTSPSFPPFVIRHERDEFVYYRNFLELIKNGDAEDLPLQSKAIFSLPYSYYGFGLDFTDISRQPINEKYYFEAHLTSRGAFDSSLLSSRNLRFWNNRAFIVSVQKQSIPQNTNPESDDISTVFGGVIHSVQKSRDARNAFEGSKSGYLVSGEFNLRNRGDLTDINVDQTILFLCDWSKRLGFPKSVSSFENRICFSNNRAFPSKFWYSAVPGVRRIQVGTRRQTSTGTTVQNPFTIDVPLYRYIFRDQLTFFDRESTALGLSLSDVSSPGSIFINDDLGFSIQWLKSGEVLYIGTNQGVFISLGTDASASSTTPFNQGFRKPVDVPVKDIRPELVNRTLYFISDDNKMKSLIYSSESGYSLNSLDEVFDPIIQDASEVSSLRKSSTVRSLIIGRDLSVLNSGIFYGDTRLNFQTTIGKTVARFENSLNRTYSSALHSFLVEGTEDGIEEGTFKKENFSMSGLCYFYEINDSSSSGIAQNRLARTTLFDRRVSTNFDTLSKYSQNFLISGLLSNINEASVPLVEDKNSVVDMTLTFSFLRRFKDFKSDELELKYVPDSITYKNTSTYGVSEESILDVRDFVDTPVFGTENVDFPKEVNSFLFGKISSGFVKESHSLNGIRLIGFDLGRRIEFNPNNKTIDLLRAVFDKNPYTEGVRKIRVSKGSNSYTLTLDPDDIFMRTSTPDHHDKADIIYFGKKNITVFVLTKRDSDIQEGLSGFNFDAELDFRGEVVCIEFFGENDELFSKREIEFHSTNLTVQRYFNNGERYIVEYFRDNLNLDYSGRFKVQYGNLKVYENFHNLSTQKEDFDKSTTGFSIPFLETVRRQIELAVSANNGLFNVTIEGISNPSELANLPSTQGAGFITSQQEFIDYDLELSNTEVLYDWTKKALFVFRKASGFSAFCLNPETGVKGWTTGDLNLGNPVYVRNIKFNTPNSYPSILGVDSKGRVVLFTQGLYNGALSYIDNLPNCLDSHVVFSIGEDKVLNYDTLKDKLLNLEFELDDVITISDDKTIIVNKRPLKYLSGQIELPDSNGKFIVGSSFESTLVNYMPLAQDRRNATFSVGSRIALSNLTLQFMFASEFFINRKLVKKFLIDPRVQYERFGTFFQEVVIESFHTYDPLIELKIDSPRPFCIGGYSVEVNVGGSA